MKTFLAIVLGVLILIFMGGRIPIGGAPVFWHLDRALGYNFFMKVYFTTFRILHRDTEGDESDGESREEGIQGFQEKPVGFDKKGYYRRLDDAAQ